MKFWRRVVATLIDLTLIYCITTLLDRLMWLFFPVHPGLAFTAVFLSYYVFFYIFLTGQTPGKILFGLQLSDVREVAPTVRQVIGRERGFWPA
jgi:uncharacterized RDD family membrane protein YckC